MEYSLAPAIDSISICNKMRWILQHIILGEFTIQMVHCTSTLSGDNRNTAATAAATGAAGAIF